MSLKSPQGSSSFNKSGNFSKSSKKLSFAAAEKEDGGSVMSLSVSRQSMSPSSPHKDAPDTGRSSNHSGILTFPKLPSAALSSPSYHATYKHAEESSQSVRDFELAPAKRMNIADVQAHSDRPIEPSFQEFTFSNGDMYAGEWKGGMLCGKGKYIKAGGVETWEGEWSNDVLCGMTEHHDSEGRTYIGQFKDGFRHGRGRLIIPGPKGKQAASFECEWRKGAMLGKVSRLTYAMFEGKTGRRLPFPEAKMIPGYTNTLNQDEPPKPRAEARRRYDVSAGGRRHEFPINRGGYNHMLDPTYEVHTPRTRKFLSKGAVLYKEGMDEEQVVQYAADDVDEVYEGGVKLCSDGEKRRYGPGELKWGPGLKNSYKGDWLYNKKHGKGQQVWETGEVYNGTWVHHKMEGEGSYRWPNGAKYNGEFVQGKKCGYGVQIWPTADKTGVVEYEGDWRDNRQNGCGVLTKPDGRRYEGDWTDGRMKGQGALFYANGWTYKGEFQNGMKHGTGTKTEWYGSKGRRYRVWYRFNVLTKKRDLGSCTRNDLDPEIPALRRDAEAGASPALGSKGVFNKFGLKLNLKLDLQGTLNDAPLPLSPPQSPPFSPTENNNNLKEMKYPIGNWSHAEQWVEREEHDEVSVAATSRRNSQVLSASDW